MSLKYHPDKSTDENLTANTARFQVILISNFKLQKGIDCAWKLTLIKEITEF